ncbi:Dabb family protein [Sphingobacterium lactis]|uniref:Stress responsive A/B Barrel Domain n=1 Tax=Sphingobacterium lactis TaxID=797291 RepID=A0A1H5Y7M8_9SPHI|nr:Dabb family protein [Sphingobacterium lactis]SEG19948.1 Stress responsive A/B Barrel Domain [Sphingobacterium lactis]
MKRNHFIKALCLTAGATTLLGSCASGAAQQDAPVSENESGHILHSVYFWLKPGLSAEEEQDFLNFFEALKKVPGIHAFQVGKPAPTTPRDVVDNSFSYAIYVTFKTMEDINTYEKHPDHLAASEKYGKYWTKVEVKDSILV